LSRTKGAARDKDGLTPYQRVFALKFVELGNATEAYLFSHSDNNSRDTAKVAGYKLLQEEPIKVEVDRLRDKMEEAILAKGVTKNSVTVDLLRSQAIAIEKMDSSAHTKAVMAKAKIHGLEEDNDKDWGPTINMYVMKDDK